MSQGGLSYQQSMEGNIMRSIIYLVGLVVIVLAIVRFVM